MSAVRLSLQDNIVVLTCGVAPGALVAIDGRFFVVEKPIGLGHKLAFRWIAKGEKIIKYGAEIGSATCDIQPGDHVHLHNMKSDYMPTYTLENGRLFEGGR